jgi:oligoribonuclease
MTRTDLLIWLDLEMTGLNPDEHVILEIGTVVTDSELKTIAEGPALAIHPPEEALQMMDEWCRDHHGRSGLIDRCRESKMTLAEAERQTLEFLSKHCAPQSSPLCGNSIWQDRRFLLKYMPTLNPFFHYRNIDVSSLKELVRRWYPASLHSPEKKGTHSVLEDIRESIDELKYYRRVIFK